jgi:hypothetical protein
MLKLLFIEKKMEKKQNFVRISIDLIEIIKDFNLNYVIKSNVSQNEK